MYTYFCLAHLVDLSEGSSSQQAQISETLIEIGLLFAGIIHRTRRGGLTTKGTRQGRPRGWLLREHPAQRGTSLGWWQRGQRVRKLGRGRVGRVGRRRGGEREAALFEGEGLLCVGEVGRNREGHPGHCGFHCH